MAHEKRCDNCCFSTFATGTGRAALICRQKKGSVGTWNIRPLLHQCPNFYPSRASRAQNRAPRLIPLTRGQFAIVDAEGSPMANSLFLQVIASEAKTSAAISTQNMKS
jgi:hypothetical protein